MFGQTELTTKIYPFTMSWDANAEEFNFDLQSITGYDLDNALVNFYSINEYDIYGGEAEFEVYLSNEGYQGKFALTRFLNGVLLNDNNGGGENSSFIYSESFDYTIRALQGYQTPGFATINFAITAEFPQEDTGYIEDGFDYCINVGANLLSSPCSEEVAITEAIPSEIANNLTGIITQGGATSQIAEGVWVGSLNGLGGGKGYWFLSQVEGCFNYTCSE